MYSNRASIWPGGWDSNASDVKPCPTYHQTRCMCLAMYCDCLDFLVNFFFSFLLVIGKVCFGDTNRLFPWLHFTYQGPCVWWATKRWIAPCPDLLETKSPALLPHGGVVNNLRNSYWLLCLFLDQESPLFYKCNACDFDNLKVIVITVCFRFKVYCM